MVKDNKTEVWLRGPLNNIPALLQPVAHALLQTKEEIAALMENFSEELLWEKPAGLASPGFHLQHLAGVLNRLFTYAKGEQLSQQQLKELASEGKPDANLSVYDLIKTIDRRIDEAISQLAKTDETTLTESRTVGRMQLPSTIIGLYVHAAEHTMRHVGQLLVTVKILSAKNQQYKL
jgi:uncharacterized damage-inducible protein DinB